MNIDAVRDLAWPITISLGLLTFLFFIIAFRKSIIEYIGRAKITANSGDKSIEISPAEKALVQEAIEASKESFKEEMKNEIHQALQSSLYYGAYYTNIEAFAQASTWISDFLKENQNKEITVDIKMTVVGMAYSWTGLLDKIPAWLEEHHSCHIKTNILLVNSEYINNLPIATTPRNWGDESARRIGNMKDLVECLSHTARNRLTATIKTYESIPQYHGILINNDHLFLGRTDWKFNSDPKKYPELTVGQNRYRYFNRQTNQGHDRGSERVDLFLHWHTWLWEYSSKETLNFENGVEQKINTKNKY